METSTSVTHIWLHLSLFFYSFIDAQIWKLWFCCLWVVIQTDNNILFPQKKEGMKVHNYKQTIRCTAGCLRCKTKLLFIFDSWAVHMTNGTTKWVDVSSCVYSGRWCGIQQSGGGTGSDHLLVGRVGQVDSLHAHMWRWSDDTGETLPQTEVRLSERTHAHTTSKL